MPTSIRIGDVAIVNPTRPRDIRQLPDDQEVTFVPMPAVNQQTGSIDGAQIKRLGDVRNGFTYFAEGDVIFAKITPCMQNGKSAIAYGLKNGLAFGSTEFHVIRPNEDRVLPEWIWYFVRQKAFLTEGTRHFRGAVGQQRVPPDYIEDTVIPVPSLREQRRIVTRIRECMERVEEIHRLRAETSVEAESIEYACFYDALVQGINEQGWPVGTLGEVARSFRYGTSTKAHTQPIGSPVLRMGNIQSGYLDTSELKYIELSESDLERYRLHAGDILINRTNSLELVGKAATFNIQEDRWVYASYLVRAEVDTTRALPEFVTAVINSRMGREYVLRTARRAIGMVNLNAKEMAKFPLPLPSIAEQQRITDLLGSAHRLAEELRKSLAGKDADTLKESILRRAFAGEL